MPSANDSNTTTATATTLYPHHTDFTGRDPPPTDGYSWDQIKDAIKSNSLHALRRTDKGQYEYEQWQDKIDRKTYKNIGEYIAFVILQWPDLQDPADTVEHVSHTIESPQSKEERYRTIEPRLTLRQNHYPFPVQQSIQYFVLWSTRDMSLLSERTRLDTYLQLQFIGNQDPLAGPIVEKGLSPEVFPPVEGKKKQWMWFVNPIELRSVATVHHIHVFVRDVHPSEPSEVFFERP
ncbi:hypothetical protein BG015_000544 [Linnemannia schmuckeri]|uniref:Uncharacterized protein n=1 Tax=Linnemannia schmuckeri TaxID=64567 RepID=A0A9P5RTN6_9FUNG|nr:hypothetical protein BG015_000544 [Linnemannia schmuckeri]